MEKNQSLITMFFFFFYCLLVLQVISFYLVTSFSFSFNCFNWNGNNFANKLLILGIRLSMVPDLKVQTLSHALTAQVCDMKYASRSRAMSHTFSLQAWEQLRASFLVWDIWGFYSHCTSTPKGSQSQWPLAPCASFASHGSWFLSKPFPSPQLHFHVGHTTEPRIEIALTCSARGVVHFLGRRLLLLHTSNWAQRCFKYGQPQFTPSAILFPWLENKEVVTWQKEKGLLCSQWIHFFLIIFLVCFSNKRKRTL